MSEAVDRILANPHDHYVLRDGRLYVRPGATRGLTISELAELVGYRAAITVILTLEPAPNPATDEIPAPETANPPHPIPTPTPPAVRPPSREPRAARTPPPAPSDARGLPT